MGGIAMVKKTKKCVLDTATATIEKKVTVGIYGDPKGYEMTMYRSPEGHYFLYTYGGKETPYSKEKITYMFKGRAWKWMAEN